MDRFCTLALAALLSACASSAARQDDDAESLRRRVKELTAELERARLELFTLRLRVARAEKRADEEVRLIREEGLRSEHDALRLQALREIAGLPAERQKAFAQDVRAASRAASPAVRVEAILLIGRQPDSEAPLIEATRDALPEVRRAAASVLRTGTAAAVDALVALIADPVPEVRMAALESTAASRSDRALDVIIHAATHDRDAAVVQKAIDVLGTLASPAARGTLETVLASATSDAIRWSAINALGKIGVPESAPVIRPYLDGERPANLREIAAQALGKLRDRVSVPALQETLRSDPETRVREAAARALGLIGGSDVLRDALLPAALDEQDHAVQRAAWEGALAAAGDRFEDLHLLAASMFERGRRVEVEAVCRRLHLLTPEGEARERHLALEERIADAAVAARDYRAALGHLRVLLAASPRRPEVLGRIGRCHLELGEHDAARKALAEAAAAAEPGTASWWGLKVELVAALEGAGAHADVVRETADTVNGKAVPPQAAAALDAARKRATAALVRALADPNAAARRPTVEAVKPLGKRIIGALATAVVDASLPDRAGVLEAGNAIAGTAFTDLSKAAEIADAWRAWAQK